MTLFALADPHLGFGVDKPMDIFGFRWQDHVSRLEENWRQLVADGDTVLIPGDISWAMQLQDALPDLQFIDRLPGRKILSRGNHDYWWSSLAKMEQFCRSEQLTTLSFLRNNGILLEDCRVICGTRGWILPDDPDFSPADRKIFERETGRLRLSLEAAERIREPGDRLLVFLHYPPIGRNRSMNSLTSLMTEHQADLCVYGHVHGEAAGSCYQGTFENVQYRLASADYLGFKPLRL
ncbi:MAG TPA: serine/threonine protein phosphatase [Clostridiales bacterium]|nr:serine/threonine protein phosphatase [Clostridiales bacterium]